MKRSLFFTLAFISAGAAWFIAKGAMLNLGLSWPELWELYGYILAFFLVLLTLISALIRWAGKGGWR